MAEVTVHEGKTLEQMEKEITCSVCQEHYTEPKVLPCLHYYCKECVLKMSLRTASNKPFSCPECRKDTILPEGGVEELKTAFFVNRYKSNFYAMERVHGKVEVRCEGCSDSGGKAEAFCRQCVAFICADCVRQHKRLKPFSSHEVDSLEDLKQGHREIPVKEPPTKQCVAHEEPLIIYCFDCNVLICRDCTVKVHRDHNFEFSKIAAPKTKQRLQSEVKLLVEIRSSLSSGIKEIQTAKQEVKAQGNSVASTIHASFNQLQLILDERKQQLLQESDNKIQEKLDTLAVQEKNLSLSYAKIQSIVEFSERFVGHSSDSEVMSMHSEIKKRMELEIEEQSQSRRSLVPAEEADIGVEVGCVEALQQFCQTKAKITQLAIDPAYCTVRGEGVESAMVNQTSVVTLTTKLSNNKTTRHRVVAAGQLKSLYSESVIECEVEQSRPGKYRIRYTPTMRGRHELTVSVDGQQVAGSPFPVSVYIHPKQLDKPVKVWTGLHVPTCIAACSTGEIITASFNGDLGIVEKNLVKGFNSGPSNVCGLSLDKEDRIYCTSTNTNKIMRCDKKGGDSRIYEVEQVKGPGHVGIAVVEDEVLVCELRNEGTIMVYDMDFKYKRRIEHGERMLKFISADACGNIYATDNHNAVCVFSKDGVFLNSFGYDKDGVNQLNNPWGICVSGQFVYVANSRGRNVAVFTTAGKYVTSIGLCSDKDGEVDNPVNVCVDLDNFLYIVDARNGRIHSF